MEARNTTDITAWNPPRPGGFVYNVRHKVGKCGFDTRHIRLALGDIFGVPDSPCGKNGDVSNENVIAAEFV